MRGLAALTVLFHHALLTSPEIARHLYGEGDARGPAAWFVYSPLHLGWAGEEAVLVFFVLSGVVIALPFLRTPVSMTWRGYYPSRLTRLYLPVAASVALAVAWYFIVPRDASSLDSLWIQDHDRSVTAVTIGMTTVLLFGTSMFNSPLWSLRWEVWFSLLLPAYVAVARWRRGRVVVAVLLAVGILVLGLRPAGGLFYLLTFGAGVAVAVKLDRLRQMRMGAGVAVSLLTLAVVGLTWRWTSAGLGLDAATAAWRPAATVGAVLVIVVAVAWRAAAQVLETRTLQWLGTVSFSLYLTHEPVVVSLAHVVPPGARWATPLVAVALCLPLAWIFYRCVEAPSHQLAKRVRAKIDARHARGRADTFVTRRAGGRRSRRLVSGRR